ncbi:hypothetical protein ACPZ8P_27740, partial [Klebsiella pneumoniae subsp. pneumoniae]
FLRTTVNDFMDSVHHIWCPLSSQEYQDLPDGAETTLTNTSAVQNSGVKTPTPQNESLMSRFIGFVSGG